MRLLTTTFVHPLLWRGAALSGDLAERAPRRGMRLAYVFRSGETQMKITTLAKPRCARWCRLLRQEAGRHRSRLRQAQGVDEGPRQPGEAARSTTPTGGTASIKTEPKADLDAGKDIASAPRFGSTLGTKTS
jgi:hypothetical protein